MEGLRHSLLAPSVTSVLMIFGVAHAMKEYVTVKYAAKDDNGKPLLPHPYAPWKPLSSKDPKHVEAAEKALRGYRMFENVKEWTFLSLPSTFLYYVNICVLFWRHHQTNKPCSLIPSFLPSYSLSYLVMWIFSIYGSTLPFMTTTIMDGITVASGLFYFYATSKFISGYIQSTEGRISAFQMRRRTSEFWLFGSIISLFWFAVDKFFLSK